MFLHYFAIVMFITYIILIGVTFCIMTKHKSVIKDVFKYSNMSLINKLWFVLLPFIIEIMGAVMSFSLI
jgi:hypothetical protein